MATGPATKDADRNLGIVQRLHGAELHICLLSTHWNVTAQLWNTTPHGKNYAGDCTWHPEAHGAPTINGRFLYDAANNELRVKLTDPDSGGLHSTLMQFNLHAKHGRGLTAAPWSDQKPGEEERIGGLRWKVVHWGHAHGDHGR